MEKYIVGIDEVGRGPLAGPVTVCGVILTPTEILTLERDTFKEVKDSKQLSEKQREQYFESMKDIVRYECYSVSPRDIDKIGIQAAIYDSIVNVLLSLDTPPDSIVLLDGGLKAPSKYTQKSIIKGDEKEISIAIASIIAKVSRDSYMIDLSAKVPEYNFAKNKGYGTPEHIQAISTYGISKYHRKTYCKNFDTINI